MTKKGWYMIIVLTSQNKKHITAHAGKCRKFWRYEITNNQVVTQQLIEVAKEDSFSQSGAVLEQLMPMDLFVSSGMGDGLKNRMQAFDVAVQLTEMVEVDVFIQNFCQQE